MNYTRRKFIFSAAGLAFFYAIPGKTYLTQRNERTRLILLGTKGGPVVTDKGSNPSTLIIINEQAYLIDCGYGTTRQMIAAGIPLNTLRYIFITHHHSDHILEYGPLIYNAWPGRLERIDTYGPAGLLKMTKDFFEYMKIDIETRIVDEGRKDIRKIIFPHEVFSQGVIMQNKDVKISACKVIHPQIVDAYAYRFDAKDKSIVISGDTTYCEELADFSKDADVLVHEVMYLPGIDKLIKRAPDAATLREHLIASHTTTEDVGKIAAKANVKTLVLTHFVPGDDPSITENDWIEGVRKYYNGKIIVGKDLLEI